MKYVLFLIVFLFIGLSLGEEAFAQRPENYVPNSQTGPAGAAGQTGPAGDRGDTGPVGLSNPVSIKNPIAADNIQELFQAIIDIVIVFAIPIIVLFIIYAGFLYVTARGNEETIKRAHMALLYALIGGLLILGARVLIEVVAGTVEGVTGNEVRGI